MDKISKIKAEIERLKHEGTNPYDRRTFELLCEIGSYINNLPEEPVSEDLEEELDLYIKDNFTIDKEQRDRFGLDEKDYMYSMDKSDMLTMVRHFTEVQHKKDVVITEDLIATAFANGMADMKQQMMKGAIDATIEHMPNDYGEFRPCIHVKVDRTLRKEKGLK